MAVHLLFLQANILLMSILHWISPNPLAKLIYRIEVQFSEKHDLLSNQPICFYWAYQSLENALFLQDVDNLLLFRESDIQEHFEDVASIYLGVDAVV